MSDPFGMPGGFDPNAIPFFREMQKLLSWSGGPVNWDFAQQTAASVLPASERTQRPAIGFTTGGVADADAETQALREAVRVAELWLDQVTSLPAVDGPVRALSRAEWLRLANSSDGLGPYVEPIAESTSKGFAQGLDSMGLPPEMTGMLGAGGGPDALGAVFGRMGAMMYGLQTGVVAGHLSAQLLGTYDLGVPASDPRLVATVGDNVRRFAVDNGFDIAELRHWIALRETAHRRQFAGVPWLRGHLTDLLRAFADAAADDDGGLMGRLGELSLDPTALGDPERMREAMESGGFAVEPTPEQHRVLARLQALVAFTEAWVDTVVRVAAADKLPSLARIEEAVTRRRAEHGPGERFLQQLVGIDLKPSDRAGGRAFVTAVLAARGQVGLDRVWRDADLLPSPEEIADPSRWLVRLAATEDPGTAPAPAPVADLEIPDDLSGLDET